MDFPKTRVVSMKATGERAVINDADFNPDVHVPEGTPAQDTAPVGELEAPPFLKMTQKDAIAFIKKSTDPVLLGVYRDMELNADARTKVVDAIDKQLETLADEDEE